jgi:hypothetical protein
LARERKIFFWNKKKNIEATSEKKKEIYLDVLSSWMG